MIQTYSGGLHGGGDFHRFRGTIEQGCPLCKWFGLVHAFPAHWRSHDLIDRAVFHLGRLAKRARF